LQDKAARVGFDWPSLALVFDKMREELAELEAVVTTRLLAPSGLPAPEPGSPAGEASGDPGLTKTAAPGPAPSGRLPAGESEGAPGVTKTAAPGPAPSGRLPAGESEGALKEEFGDLLFVMANVARHLGIDPEAALRGANQKFVRRFAYIERRLDEQGRTPLQSSLAEMDALWDEAKAEEKTRG
jgi:ATP diphosphatase